MEVGREMAGRPVEGGNGETANVYIPDSIISSMTRLRSYPLRRCHMSTLSAALCGLVARCLALANLKACMDNVVQVFMCTRNDADDAPRLSDILQRISRNRARGFDGDTAAWGAV